VITFVVQLWLYATPVLYTVDIIPERFRLLYALNPMVGMVIGFRTAILGGPMPYDLVIVSAVVAAALLAAGLRYFIAVERQFADVI
jgi:lipopolysaccharide transport system permease protein